MSVVQVGSLASALSLLKMLKVALLVMCGVAMARAAVARSAEDVQDYRDFLEKSVSGKYEEPLTPELAVLQNTWERSGKFEGDMVLSKEQRELLIDEYSGARNALLDKSRLWPDNVLYYNISDSYFDKDQIEAIEKGIKDLASVSCVQFKKPSPDTPNYVFVEGHKSGCFSDVGYQGRPQLLNLSPNKPGSGCFSHGTIVHEFLHALGFYHMQSTHNRDDYVKIVWDKIQQGTQHNFNKYNSSVVSNLGVEYDYGSVLHYSEYGFSIDGSKTIEPLRETTEDIGQRKGLSKGDIIKFNKLYGCPGY